MKITQESLMNMAKATDEDLKNIEVAHIEKLQTLEANYKKNELKKLIQEENRIYYGKKAEHTHKTKLNTEYVQRYLLDEIQKQYKKEQAHVYTEYKSFEKKTKDKYIEAEFSNLKNYNCHCENIINQYSKKIKKVSGGNQFIITVPTIEKILREAVYSPCKELTESNLEFNKNKKKLNKEYKKTKEDWNKNNSGKDEDTLSKVLMGDILYLEHEYNNRCTRHRYKYDIIKFHHLNNCQNCIIEKFQYVNGFHPHALPCPGSCIGPVADICR